MAYDITIRFSNGVVRDFKEITKIETRIYRYGKYEWENIKNPLDYEFKAFGDYKLTNETTSSCFNIFSYDSGSYIMNIISVEVKKTENQKSDKKENIK
ncbi:MAG: hypothetical protein K2I06_07815 [Ruminococcus sp.]|nr:hypothetical protein [Ruminococcus sp.]